MEYKDIEKAPGITLVNAKAANKLVTKFAKHGTGEENFKQGIRAVLATLGDHNKLFEDSEAAVKFFDPFVGQNITRTQMADALGCNRHYIVKIAKESGFGWIPGDDGKGDIFERIGKPKTVAVSKNEAAEPPKRMR